MMRQEQGLGHVAEGILGKSDMTSSPFKDGLAHSAVH